MPEDSGLSNISSLSFTGSRVNWGTYPFEIAKSQIIDKHPDQLKLDFALWTRQAVRLLIRQEYAIDMPIRTVGMYLKRWGFTPQKPVKFAFERKDEAVKEWLGTTYPAISKRAKSEGASIYWGDETGLRSSDVRGRGYSVRGKTPVVEATAQYQNISMVSAITNQGMVKPKILAKVITRFASTI